MAGLGEKLALGVATVGITSGRDCWNGKSAQIGEPVDPDFARLDRLVVGAPEMSGEPGEEREDLLVTSLLRRFVAWR